MVMKLLDRSVRLIGHALAWGFLAIVAMMTFEVIARYGFNAPTIWAHEIAGILAAIAFVFGGAYCMLDDSHMRITTFVENRGRWIASISTALSVAAGVIYLGGLTYASWRMVDDALFRTSIDGAWDPERSGSTWNTPAPAFIKFALFVGSALFLIVLVRSALRRGRQD